MAEHNLPWVYRPHEFDDWGWIRDAAGNLAACARGEKDDKSHDAHRADKTDPYNENAALIVRAVNNHEPLVDKLAKVVTWLDRLATAASRAAQNCSYESLREAYIADAANYRKTIADIKPVLDVARTGAAVGGKQLP